MLTVSNMPLLCALISTVFAITMVTESTPLLHQHLQHGQTHIYQLSDLVPGKLYEFKVSYPAIQPFTFTIQFTDDLDKIPQRKLLDITKEEFIPQSTSMFAIVQAHDYNKAIRHAPYVSYSVYFERVYGGVPEQAWYLIAYCALVLPCAVYAALWVHRNWMEEDPDPQGNDVTENRRSTMESYHRKEL